MHPCGVKSTQRSNDFLKGTPKWMIKDPAEMTFKALMTLKQTHRSFGVDALRGFIMVWMALDHARSFLCESNGGYEIWMGRFTHYQGDFLAFLTRFVTHLSAPGFFFIMGYSMVFLYASRSANGWTKSQIYLYFVKRGIVLMGLQFLVENPAWAIGFGEMPLYFGVLFALGCTMIAGILFLEFPPAILVVTGILLISATEALLPEAGGYVLYPFHQRILLLPGFTPGAGIFVLYPVIPWLGVVLLGMAFGKLLTSQQKNSRSFPLQLGLFLTVLFVAVRVNGGFGNIRMTGEEGVIGFLNVVKYPPSLSLLLLTLGLNLIALSLFNHIENRAGKLLVPLVILGRAPLFFYLLHLFLYAFMGMVTGPEKMPLIRMYGFWILGLVIMLPLCAVWADMRMNSKLSSPMRLI